MCEFITPRFLISNFESLNILILNSTKFECLNTEVLNFEFAKAIWLCNTVCAIWTSKCYLWTLIVSAVSFHWISKENSILKIYTYYFTRDNVAIRCIREQEWRKNRSFLLGSPHRNGSVDKFAAISLSKKSHPRSSSSAVNFKMVYPRIELDLDVISVKY